MEPHFESSPECTLQSELNCDKILVSVMNIKKVIPPKRIKIKLIFKDTILGCSPPVDVLEASNTAVDWEIVYQIEQIPKFAVADLAANPLVFSVLQQDLFLESDLDKNEEVKNQKAPKKIAKSNKSKLTVESTSSTNKKSTKSKGLKKSKTQSIDVSESFETLGVCNLDLFSLIQGSEAIEEVLLIHPTLEQTGSHSVAWTNLPTIAVTVKPVGNILNDLQEHFTNALFFTLESLCNITPYFTENTQVSTVFPLEEEKFEIVKFTDGSLVTDRSTWFSKKKKWNCLSSMRGLGGLSLYKLNNENFFELKNTMEYNLPAEGPESIPRIQWLQFFRRHFTAESLQVFKQKLVTFRCWPIEVLITKSNEKDLEYLDANSGKAVSKKTPEKVGKKELQSEDESNNHYVAFVDLSSLLYPGVTNTRVVSQLFSYTEEAIKNQFGSELKMFGMPKPKNDSISKSVKEKKGKSAPSTPVSKKKIKNEKDSENMREDRQSTPSEPQPVFNSFGEPVFVIVQVALLKPLIEKKTREEIIQSIEEIIPARPLPTREEIVTLNAISAFDSCIERLIHNTHEQYEHFYTQNEKMSNEKSSKYFFMHLHMTGAYAKMKETMKEYLEPYVYDGLGFPEELSKLQAADQDMLSLNYTALVDKVIRQVNALTNYGPGEYDTRVSTNRLLYFAVEAVEEGSFDKAQEYLLERIEKSKNTEPKLWFDYAVFWVKRNEFEKAGECIREAISLNTAYTPGLFFIGLLSWLTEDYKVAERFLLAAVATDPFFLEGWVALHIFHKQMNNPLDATEELLNGKKCIREVFPLYSALLFPTLSWSPDLADRDRVFLLTAVYMIQLSFPELAELALSYDLLLHGRTVNYLYYLAVCHYQQGRYKESIHHLEEASRIVWEETHLWSLKGHCFYKLQIYDEAKKALQFAINCSDDLEDKHLVNLRLGKILISEGDHQTAKVSLMEVCDISPTPLSWLELGIATYMEDNMKDAELALTEANNLDPRLARTWGYLALVNLLMAKFPVYHRCLNQAMKFGLDDPILLERLKVLGSLIQPLDHN